MIELLRAWQPAVALAGFGVFWFWESLATYFPARGRVGHAARNLVIAGLNAVVAGVLFAGGLAVASLYAQRSQTGLLYRLSVDDVTYFALAWLALDCWTYWWHRANHAVPFLWRFHSMHHSDPAMDVSTATRFHLGEVAISAALRMGLVLLVGIELHVIAVYELMLLLSTQFHHSNIALPATADRILRSVLVSPNMHKVHHSKVRAEMDSNYTSVLSVWDRLFGSFRPADDCRDIRFGVPGLEGTRYQTLAGMLRTPIERAGGDRLVTR